MQENKDGSKKQIELEDLLRLKRAERPDPAFWETFDRELHQRQLQALVRQDFAFTRLWRFLAGHIHPGMPVAAAALFVMAFVLVGTFPAQVVNVRPMVSNVPAAEMAEAVAESPTLPDTASARFIAHNLSASAGELPAGYTPVAANTVLSARAEANVRYAEGRITSNGFRVSDRTLY